MVIFNHTAERGFYRYATDVPGSLLSVCNLIPSISCKAAVPMFFMMSGSLLLSRQETVTKTYHRTFRVLFDLLIFSLLYYAVDSYLTGQTFDIKATLLNMLSKSYWHLWYLYAYIIFIITLPFFRDFVSGLKSQNAIMFYTIAVIYMYLMPIFEYFVFEINTNLKPTWIMANIFVYPLMGYIIDNIIDISKISKKNMILIWIANILCFVMSEFAEYCYLCKEPGSRNETFLQITCIVNAPVIYITVKWLSQKINYPPKIAKLITETGKCTFGIYLLHIMFQWRIQPLYRLWTNIETKHFGAQWGVYITCIAVFVIAWITTLILRKVPMIKKML